VVRLPSHPSLKELPGRANGAQNFLHVDVLVPERVDARQEGDCAVPHIARVVHVLRLLLHLRVAHPQRRAAVVAVQRALEDGARAGQVALSLLPHRVLDPRAVVPPHATDGVLELLALLKTVVRKLLRVRYLGRSRAV